MPSDLRRGNRRRWLDRVFVAAAAACGLAACALLLGVAGSIVWRGMAVLNWGFVSRLGTGSGGTGGILYEILGTVILIATALAVSAPLATGVALVEAVYLAAPRARRWLFVSLYAANSVPSVLFGVAGLIVFSRWLAWGKSWLAGGILLGLMILPTVSVALIERLRSLPRKYVEAATGLGLSRSQVIWSVLLPQSLGGLISGLLLGLARAAGDGADPLRGGGVLGSRPAGGDPRQPGGRAAVPHLRPRPGLARPRRAGSPVGSRRGAAGAGLRLELVGAAGPAPHPRGGQECLT